ncbi:hypothetical protein J7E28_14105 [Microbacterium sp. ISL-108]|nr:hypothetical protein [Microbacterium sp. ISL-108]
MMSLIVGSAALLALTGCISAPAPSATPSVSASGAASPGTESAPPTLVPSGSASENLAVFTAVAEEVWSSEDRGSGRAYVDALTAAGFERTAMQVTQDQSTVGNPAESLQFSVRWGEDECLIGQVGPSTGEVVTVVMPQLAEGRCLVGSTRPIDW